MPDSDKLCWLKRIDTLLEDEAVIDTVASALEERWRHSRTRVHEGTPAEVVFADADLEALARLELR